MVVNPLQERLNRHALDKEVARLKPNVMAKKAAQFLDRPKQVALTFATKTPTTPRNPTPHPKPNYNETQLRRVKGPEPRSGPRYTQFGRVTGPKRASVGKATTPRTPSAPELNDDNCSVVSRASKKDQRNTPEIELAPSIARVIDSMDEIKQFQRRLEDRSLRSPEVLRSLAGIRFDLYEKRRLASVTLHRLTRYLLRRKLLQNNLRRLLLRRFASKLLTQTSCFRRWHALTMSNLASARLKDFTKKLRAEIRDEYKQKVGMYKDAMNHILEEAQQFFQQVKTHEHMIEQTSGLQTA